MNRKTTAAYWVLGPLFVSIAASADAADWNQWRGPNRDGAAPQSPRLIESLPEAGLGPAWITEPLSPRGGNGGWASPVVADGRVYVSLQLRDRRAGVKLPPEKFPALSKEDREQLAPGALAEYEGSRQAEQRARRDQEMKFTDVVHCFEMATGRLLWTDEHESVFTYYRPSSSPAVVDDRLYMLGSDRIARCLDAASGSVVWETTLFDEYQEPEVASSFVVAEGVAVILAGRLFGINARSGKVIWQGDPQSTSGTYSSPVVWQAGGKSYVIANCGGSQTACFDLHAGTELWREKAGASKSTPLVVGDRLITYASSRKQGVGCYRLGVGKPQLLWNFQGVADAGASPVVANGLAFAYGDKRLACVDLDTGKARWQTDLDISAARYTSLIAADGKVFLAWDGLIVFAASGDEFKLLFHGKVDREGTIATEAQFRRRLNLAEIEKQPDGPQKAEQIWRREVGNQGPLECATPAIADGRLLMRLGSSRLACYDLRAGLK
ncbi:MAG: PQQ-binding-like beta-propeller repeat protein [Planctomycetales bacterium]